MDKVAAYVVIVLAVSFVGALVYTPFMGAVRPTNKVYWYGLIQNLMGAAVALAAVHIFYGWGQ